MSEIAVGVIGCGFQGRAHLEALAHLKGARVVAVADIDPERADDAACQYDVEHHHADARDLLAHVLDLVVVATMPDSHYELVLRACDAGAHVFCEKPFALDAGQAAEMVRAADRAERLLMVGFNMRYMAATAAVRRFMAEGLLGEPVCARGFMLADDIPWWGKHYVRAVSGGGALASSAVHMLDLVMWLAGNPRPLTATASATTIFPHKRLGGGPPGATKIYDVEDVVFGHIRFEGGFWLSIEGSWMYDRPGWNYSFDMMGTRGQAHLQPLELYTEENRRVTRVWKDVSEDPDFVGALPHEVADVVASVRSHRIVGPVATGRQALAVQAVVDALYRSVRERREVDVEVADV